MTSAGLDYPHITVCPCLDCRASREASERAWAEQAREDKARLAAVRALAEQWGLHGDPSRWQRADELRAILEDK